MSTTTSNLSLRKPETSDQVNVATDIANNMQILDDKWATAAPTAEAIGDTVSNGSALTVARSDHRHAMPGFGSPVSTGTANANGSAATVARSDHVHVNGTGAINATAMLASGVVSQVGTAAGSSGTITTTSASFVDVTDMSVTMTLNSGIILVFFTCEFYHPTIGTLITFAVNINGSDVYSEEHNIYVANHRQVAHVIAPTSGLSGSQTIKGRWATSAGTVTAQSNFRYLTVLELKR